MSPRLFVEKSSYVEDSHEYRYTYDKRGNLTLEENCERTTQGNKWITEATYTYNAANRLSIGTNAKGEKSVYTYNGLGQRVRNEYIVQDNGYDYTTFDCTPPSVEVDFETPEVVVRDFVIDQTSPIEEVLVESEKDGFDYRYTVGLDRISVNVLSPDPDTNHERTQTATKQWLHSDRLGSTVNSTDSFGRVTERTDYNEWGEITFHEKIQNVLGYRTTNTDQTYTNHDYDVVLGLYYAKARMYDPREKRFAARDILSGYTVFPTTLNLYAYVVDNPLTWIDSNGMEIQNPITALNSTSKLGDPVEYDGKMYYPVTSVMSYVGGKADYNKSTNTTSLGLTYKGTTLTIQYCMDDVPRGFLGLKAKNKSIFYGSGFYNSGGHEYHLTAPMPIYYQDKRTYVNNVDLQNYFKQVWCEESDSASSQPPITNSKPISRAQGESHRFSQMAICTDGTGGPEGSATYQPETAFSIQDQGETIYLNASRTNYVVIPLDHSGSAKLGDIAVLIDHGTGKYVYCIIGDVGPAGQYREVSIAAAHRLGYPNASGESGPSGDFEFILYPNSKKQWTANNLQGQIDKAGPQYYS